MFSMLARLSSPTLTLFTLSLSLSCLSLFLSRFIMMRNRARDSRARFSTLFMFASSLRSRSPLSLLCSRASVGVERSAPSSSSEHSRPRRNAGSVGVGEIDFLVQAKSSWLPALRLPLRLGFVIVYKINGALCAPVFFFLLFVLVFFLVRRVSVLPTRGLCFGSGRKWEIQSLGLTFFFYCLWGFFRGIYWKAENGCVSKGQMLRLVDILGCGWAGDFFIHKETW